MNPVEHLLKIISNQWQDAKIHIDQGIEPSSMTWVDVQWNDQAVSIQWRANSPFGLTLLPADGYGEGADETFETCEELIDRIAHLFKHEETK